MQELRRRKVFRVGGVYLLVAWAVLQVGDVVVEPLRLPSWTMTLLIVLSALGLPVALVLAWAFDASGDGVQKEQSPGWGSRSRAGAMASIAVVAALALGGAGWWAFGRGEPVGGPAVDSNVVAVFPFRTAGAAEELEYLREGMIDLLATKLTGDAGPRAIDPRTVLSAWRRAGDGDGTQLPQDSALDLARRLGAGQLLLGAVVGTPAHVTLSAEVLDVGTGETRARATTEGPRDSIPALVDRLTATLLTLQAGEGERLTQLTSTSLPALRAYLAAQSAYRHGRYDEALERFRSALREDSTFALAGIGLTRSASWLSGSATADSYARGLRLAWAERERLSPRDRAYLEALAGLQYPDPTPRAEELAAWESFVDRWPDDPEAVFHLGDRIFHYGASIDVRRPWERASRLFHESLELDPSFLQPRQHLLEMAFEKVARGGDDTAAVRRWGESLLAIDTSGSAADQARLLMTLTLNPEGPKRVMEGMDTLPRDLIGILTREPLWGSPRLRPVAGAALRSMQDRASTASERGAAAWTRRAYALNRGRPAEAALAAERLAALYPQEEWFFLPVQQVMEGLYWDGAPGATAAAARELEQALAGLSAQELDADHRKHLQLCALEQWRLWNGEIEAAPGTIERLARVAERHEGSEQTADRLCARMLSALHAHQTRAPGAMQEIRQLDDLAATGPTIQWLREPANLMLVDLYEQHGDLERALQAARRRPLTEPNYLTPFFREQGRLAARLGHTAEAIDAYSRYLALRYDPEPVHRPEVERVREALAALVAERS